MLKLTSLVLRRIVLALILGPLGVAVHAANSFPALSRPALVARTPERQVMQAAAKAGERIVAVGERGLVILSDTGGKTWKQAARVPVSVTLTAVCFVNEKLGWAVGHGGTVLHTADGGDTWEVQANGEQLAKAAQHEAEEYARLNPNATNTDRLLKSAQQLVADGPDKPLLDVKFRDAQNGWVLGAFNLFFETRDGGKSWTGLRHLIDNPKEMHLYAMHANKAEVYIVGEQGQMHRSNDAGQTFQPLKSPYSGSWFSVASARDGSVVAGGLRGNTFRSSNHGESWQKIEGLPPISIVSISPLTDGTVLLVNQAGQLFSLGQDETATLLKTPALPPASSVLPINAATVLLVGVAGVIPIAVNAAASGNSK